MTRLSFDRRIAIDVLGDRVTLELGDDACAYLTPDAARELARHLTEWADVIDHRQARITTKENAS